MQNLIQQYFNKYTHNSIINNYKVFLNKDDFISFNYFSWLYKNIYNYNVQGYCLKVYYGNNRMYSFMLYNNIKNVKINQLFFLNDPYIFFMKKRINVMKNKKKIFLF